MRSHWLPKAAAVVTAVLVVLPLLPKVPPAWEPIGIAPFFSNGGVNIIPAGTVALTDPWTGIGAESLETGQAVSGFRYRTLSGYYIGDDQPQLSWLQATMQRMGGEGIVPSQPEDVTKFQAQLRQFGVGAILVEPLSQRQSAVQFFTSLYGPPAEEADDVGVWLLQK